MLYGIGLTYMVWMDIQVSVLSRTFTIQQCFVKSLFLIYGMEVVSLVSDQCMEDMQYGRCMDLSY